MTPQEFIEFATVAGRLKKTYRHCETEPGRRESVAEHCWRVALMAMLIAHEPEFSTLDLNKMLRMTLIHDLGEAFTGDIPSFYKTESSTLEEKKRYNEWLASFPEPLHAEWRALLSEMEALSTPEAQIYKALDKLEAVLSHDESDISSWLPLERTLQLTYGAKESKVSCFLTRVKEQLDDWTRRKISEDKAAIKPLEIGTNSEYVFRQATSAEIHDVFQIILERMKWMDELGLEHWNIYHYDELFPIPYYEQAQHAGQLFVLEEVDQRELVCAGVLFEEDARWHDGVPSLYLHNFAARVGKSGAGALFLLFAADCAHQRGKTYLRLDVLSSSPKLQAYYEAHGFQRCGSCVDGFYHGELYQMRVAPDTLTSDAIQGN